MKKANEITFGIEIECNIPLDHIQDFVAGSYHHGEQIQIAPAGWNCQDDSSVHTIHGYRPVEIVSGILQGEAGLFEVVAIMDYLNEIGAKTNKSCGLHVHIGTDGLNQNEIIRTVNLFKEFENAFFDLNGKKANDRYTSVYCVPSHKWDGSRRASLNLKNLKKNHLEIRLFSGSMTIEVVIAAIYMAVSLVSRATDEKPVKTSHISPSDKNQVMTEYICQFMQGDCLIVPDCEPVEIFETMIKQVSQSNRQ